MALMVTPAYSLSKVQMYGNQTVHARCTSRRERAPRCWGKALGDELLTERRGDRQAIDKALGGDG